VTPTVILKELSSGRGMIYITARDQVMTSMAQARAQDG